jgi:choline dehydrogenase-like flavoprotein
MRVLVIGSGASGVQASLQLLERGVSVEMIDVGVRSSPLDAPLPRKSFSELRRSDEDQQAYFLGRRFDGIRFDDIRSGNKLSPLKAYVIDPPNAASPAATGGFVLNQSRARGGLAMSWGAGSMPLRAEDFDAFPYSLSDLEPYYDRVAEAIGVSAGQDDLADRVSAPTGLQPPLELDTPSQRLLRSYERDRARWRRRGLTMGRAWLAVNSVARPGRDPCAYNDMEFWGDADTAVYRPEWTLQQLEQHPEFEYRGGLEALSFEERGETVRLHVRNVATGERSTRKGDALVLAAAVPGSPRIVLQSTGRFGAENSVPIRTNPYSYVPCLYLPMLGRTLQDRRCSLAQLSLLFQPESDPATALFSSIFSYRSMLTFKLLNEGPIPYRFGLDVFRALLPAIMIVTVLHPDLGDGDKRYWIEKGADGESRDHVHYAEAPETVKRQDAAERRLFRHLRRLGLVPLKRIRRAPGSSIHYSGSLPLSREDRPLTCTPEGRLRPFERIWVADGSALPIMPAIPPTFTMMAQARRSADRLVSQLQTSDG